MTARHDHDAIRNVITDYLEGTIYGQRDRLERAMHPLCMQAGHYKGRYEFYGRDEFIETLGTEEPQPPGSSYIAEFDFIDVTGDVAAVKITEECFGTSFTDYLTLVRYEGRWQIVMKAFFDHGEAES